MKPVVESLQRGFTMHTYWHPLTKKWHVDLKDPLGNTVDFLAMIREDRISRNQARIRERLKGWLPESDEAVLSRRQV